MHALLRLAIAFLIAGTAPAQDLIGNGSFDGGSDGWADQTRDGAWSKKAGRNGTGGIRLRADKGTRIALWRCRLDDIPARKKLVLSGWVKGEDVGTLAAMAVQVWAEGESEMAGFGTTQKNHQLSGTFDWKRIEADVATPDNPGWIHVLVMLTGGGTAWFDDIALEVVGDANDADVESLGRSTPAAPGLFLTRGAYTISTAKATVGGEGPVLRMPVPLSYREQVPLTYELVVQPTDALISARIEEDRPGNWVAEVALRALRPDEAVGVHWRSLVLCAPRSFDDVPERAKLPRKWPEEARPWLRSSLCVQSDHERILAVSKEIRGESDDVMEIIAGTLRFTEQIYAAQEGRAMGLDAVQALDKKGSCTSCANLVAALLRGNGIPARILAGYPTWFGPLQTHYIVEAYVPDYGWYPIESTMLRAPWHPTGQLQVAIVPTEYEDKSEGRPSGAPGVPFLSLTEYGHPAGRYLVRGTVDAKRYCDHVAERVSAFRGEASERDWQRLLKLARSRWQKWVSAQGEDSRKLRTRPLPGAADCEGPSELWGLVRGRDAAPAPLGPNAIRLPVVPWLPTSDSA